MNMYNDPHIRNQIHECGGFCPYHLWRIAEIAQRDPLLGGLSLAIMVEDLFTSYEKHGSTSITAASSAIG